MLFQFLGKPIPAVPFPRVNDKEEFGKYLKAAILKAAAMWACVIAATVAIAVALVMM